MRNGRGITEPRTSRANVNSEDRPSATDDASLDQAPVEMVWREDSHPARARDLFEQFVIAKSPWDERRLTQEEGSVNSIVLFLTTVPPLPEKQMRQVRLSPHP